MQKTSKAPTARTLTEGQRAYEAKRAAKAGMTLEKWLAAMDREAQEAESEGDEEAWLFGAVD
jgi:hypothetical protein